jgi:hypothetical protein
MPAGMHLKQHEELTMQRYTSTPLSGLFNHVAHLLLQWHMCHITFLSLHNPTAAHLRQQQQLSSQAHCHCHALKLALHIVARTAIQAVSTA